MDTIFLSFYTGHFTTGPLLKIMDQQRQRKAYIEYLQESILKRHLAKVLVVCEDKYYKILYPSSSEGCYQTAVKCINAI